MDCVESNTQSKKKPSVFGGACIIACVCVGAGMLGLPAAGAGAWTVWSFIVLSLTMLIMSASGCLLLEVLKDYPYRASFSSVTKDLLGKRISVFNNVMIYFVGGILLYAYITSSGLIIHDYTESNQTWLPYCLSPCSLSLFGTRRKWLTEFLSYLCCLWCAVSCFLLLVSSKILMVIL